MHSSVDDYRPRYGRLLDDIQRDVEEFLGDGSDVQSSRAGARGSTSTTTSGRFSSRGI